MNIPNFLTLLRIIIIPFFPLFYLKYDFFNIPLIYLPYILFFILGLCELTDLIDGIWARKKNQVTDFGKIVDPMADSITNIIVFFTFTQGWVDLPIFLIFVFLYREFIISTLRTICALRGITLSARQSGKIKTFMQAIVGLVITVLLIPFSLGFITLNMLQNISLILVSISAVYSVYSAVEYFYANKKHLKNFLKC